MKAKDLMGKYFIERFDLYRVIKIDEKRDLVDLISVPHGVIMTSRSISELLNETGTMKLYPRK